MEDKMRNIRSVWFLIILFLFIGFANSSFSQDKKESPSIFIKTGKMWDSEEGNFAKNKIIKIDRNLISDVSEKMDIPKNGSVIDLSHYTVLPGLIDAHTHLLYLETLSNDPNNLTMQGMKAVIMEGDALRALHGAARAKTFLEAGITAVQDVGNSGRFADIALKIAIQDGSVIGPRMRVSGPGLCAVGGQFPRLLLEHQGIVNYEYRIVRGVEDGIQAVRENLNMGADLIKVYSDSAPNRAYLSIEEMAAIVKEAHRYGLRVTTHAVNDTSVKNAVLAGVDGVDHVYHATDETLKLIKEKGTFVIPTYTDRESFIKFFTLSGRASQEQAEKAWEFSKKRFTDLIQRFRELGITIVAGSDMYIDMKCPQGVAAKRVLYSYYECGMPVKEILKTTSINAARHLGLENKIGVIKPKAYADIIAVNGDPEEDIHCLDKVVFVMKDGKVYVNKLSSQS